MLLCRVGTGVGSPWAECSQVAHPIRHHAPGGHGTPSIPKAWARILLVYMTPGHESHFAHGESFPILPQVCPHPAHGLYWDTPKAGTPVTSLSTPTGTGGCRMLVPCLPCLPCPQRVTPARLAPIPAASRPFVGF